jgi:hypothetical protein
MAKQRKPTAAKLADKIRESKGNVSAVARAYSVPRSTVYGWIQSSATAQEALADEREQVIDVAESILFKKIIDGDMTAVAYTLNNSPEAKRRGWGNRIEHTGAGGEPLNVVIKYADD